MKKDLEIHFENWLDQKIKDGLIKKNENYTYSYKNQQVSKLGLQLIFKQELKR